METELIKIQTLPRTKALVDEKAWLLIMMILKYFIHKHFFTSPNILKITGRTNHICHF